MFGSLRGRITHSHEDGAVNVEIGGVGYEVYLPLGARGRLEGIGDEVFLAIHTHIREDAFVLYGFSSFEERAIFRMLLGVTGIGPKVALAILGRLSGAELAIAIKRQDAAAFKGISGVGKKTIERLLLELRDKTFPDFAGEASTGEMAPPPGDPAETVISALVSMGYRRAEVERALESLGPRDADSQKLSVESLLRETLAALA